MKIIYTPNLIVPSLSDEERARILKAAGPAAALVDTKDAAAQREQIVDAEVLFGRVPPDIFALNRRLRYYHSIGAGVDAILTPDLVESDVILASEKGEVGIHLAEHAFALLLALTRGIHTALRKPDYSLREEIRRSQWELYGRTMGIVGFGGTGRAVARRALGFGMRVLAVDIEDVPPEPGVEAIWKPDQMPRLLGEADVVVIGLPLTKATHHLFSRDLFRQMQRHAILINVTRGGIVFGDDLVAALEQGLIWAAGLDVTDPEPLPAGHPLLDPSARDRHAPRGRRLAAPRGPGHRDLLREPPAHADGRAAAGAHRQAQGLLDMGGLERAPQAPRRSSRPGEPGALLDAYRHDRSGSSAYQGGTYARRRLPRQSDARDPRFSRSGPGCRARPSSPSRPRGCAGAICIPIAPPATRRRRSGWVARAVRSSPATSRAAW